MSLSWLKLITVVGLGGLLCTACGNSSNQTAAICQTSSDLKRVLHQLRQHPHQSTLLQGLEDCIDDDPARLKTIVNSLPGPILSQVLAASPRLVESFASIPPQSLGESALPFLLASLNATNAAQHPQTFQIHLVGYLGAVDITELGERLHFGGGSHQLVNWFAIAFQQPLQSQHNPWPSIYTQLSKETQLFRQGQTSDRVQAFLQHPKQQALCGYLAQYLVRGWQKANLSDKAKKRHLAAATSYLMTNGSVPVSRDSQESSQLDLPQLTSKLIQAENSEFGWGYRRLLLLATHPLGEDFTKDGIPDRVRKGTETLSPQLSENLTDASGECNRSYKDFR